MKIFKAIRKFWRDLNCYCWIHNQYQPCGTCLHIRDTTTLEERKELYRKYYEENKDVVFKG